MRLMQRASWAGAVFTALCLVSSALSADSEAMPRSWMKPTSDGRHVFVILGPERVRQAELRDGDDDVPARYSASGLYVLGESAPLYTVDWYAHSVDLSSDGRLAVRHGPWASDKSDLAVAFYDNGKLLAEYEVADVVVFTWPWQHSVSHFTWKDESCFDVTTNELTLSTRSWSSFQFDATTGQVTSSFRGDYLFLAACAGVGLALAVLIIRRIRKRRKA
jgi:hypothetical protein